MYRLPTFSGLAEWQVPTSGEAKVTRIALVGSTQRVISWFERTSLVLGSALRSIVRWKCHNPGRKVGPLNDWPACALDHAEAHITATKSRNSTFFISAPIVGAAFQRGFPTNACSCP